MKSYKHKIYTTLGTPTFVDAELVPFKDYVGDSTGVPVKDYTVRGKSIVWNQLIQNGNFQDDSGWYRDGGDYIVDSNWLTFTTDGSTSSSFIAQSINKSNFIEEHYYYACATVNPSNYSDAEITFALHNGSNFQQVIASVTATSGSKYLFEEVFTLESDFTKDLTDSARIMVYAPQSNALSGYITFISNIMLIDLTKMFGSGYEPSTPAQFRAMFPEDYYEYDEGTLKSVEPTQLQNSSVERYQMADFGMLYGKGEYLDFTANFPSDTKIIKDHIYLLHGDVVGDSGDLSIFYSGNSIGEFFISVDKNNSYAIGTSKYTVQGGKANSFGYFWIYGYRCESATNIMLIDLTELFGAGNEPQTAEDFQSYFPDSYYKSNPSAYKFVNIPSSKYFPDGMRSAGSAYDEINFLSQKAIKKIGVVDMGTLNWLYNPTASHERFETVVPGIKIVSSSSIKGNIVCSKYTTVSADDVYIHAADKTAAVLNSAEQVWVYDTVYTDAAAFKAAMSGVMLYYELATPVETPITPPLQALSTFKGFTSFSAPNSLTQNGPLSVTYYTEGGANPESGWLTSYKRKLYMGRSIEWNQLLDKSKYLATQTVNGVTFTNNGDGTITANGTASSTIYYKLDDAISVSVGHKLLIYSGVLGGTWSSYMLYDDSDAAYGFDPYGTGKIYTAQKNLAKIHIFVFKDYTCTNLTFKPQLFDLTQMFGAGNEPATPAEFWTYFDHKLYPYNPGETQPLFKISRKSQWGSNA